MKKKILSLACAVAMMATMFASFTVSAADPTITLAGSVSKDNRTITVDVGTTYATTRGYTINLYETTGNITISADNFASTSTITGAKAGWNKTFKRIACAFADMTASSNDVPTGGKLVTFTITLPEALTKDVTFDFKGAPVFTMGDGTSVNDSIVKCAPLTLSPNKEDEKVDAAPIVTVAKDDTTAHTKGGYIWDVTVNPNTAKSEAAVSELKVKFTDSDSNVKETPIYGDVSKFKGAGAIGFKVGLATARTINSFEFSATNAVGTGSATWNK